MTKLLLLMLGGGLGALCRYGIALLSAQYIGSRFPWGTLLANLAGCFLIGVAFALVERGVFLSPSVRLFFMTGFLGALTTFSTYALESINAVRTGTHSVAIANFLANHIGAAVLVLGGMWLVGFILKGE